MNIAKFSLDFRSQSPLVALVSKLSIISESSVYRTQEAGHEITSCRHTSSRNRFFPVLATCGRLCWLSYSRIQVSYCITVWTKQNMQRSESNFKPRKQARLGRDGTAALCQGWLPASDGPSCQGNLSLGVVAFGCLARSFSTGIFCKKQFSAL